MTSRMGAGWMPERQRHQFRREYEYSKPVELGSLGLHQTGCVIALDGIRVVPGTDDEGGELS